MLTLHNTEKNTVFECSVRKRKSLLLANLKIIMEKGMSKVVNPFNLFNLLLSELYIILVSIYNTIL